MDVSMLITWLCCKGITMLRIIKSKTIVMIDKTFASKDQKIAIFFNSLNFSHLKGDQDDKEGGKQVLAGGWASAH